MNANDDAYWAFKLQDRGGLVHQRYAYDKATWTECEVLEAGNMKWQDHELARVDPKTLVTCVQCIVAMLESP